MECGVVVVRADVAERIGEEHAAIAGGGEDLAGGGDAAPRDQTETISPRQRRPSGWRIASALRLLKRSGVSSISRSGSSRIRSASLPTRRKPFWPPMPKSSAGVSLTQPTTCSKLTWPRRAWSKRRGAVSSTPGMPDPTPQMLRQPASFSAPRKGA
jgi:hypothetical protein